MKSKKLDLGQDFSELLGKIGTRAKNACLLDGEEDGWQSRLAWNPCETYTLEAGKPVNEEFYRFIKRHRQRGHLLVGFLSYDLGHSLHGIKPSKKDDVGLPYAIVHAYENYLEKTGGSVVARYGQDSFIKELAELKDKKEKAKGAQPATEFKPQWDKRGYSGAFEKIKRYIYDGVIYQINLTQRLEAETDAEPRELYDRLAGRNTGKMKAYFEAGDFELISMSPERFIRAKDGLVETSPIKGTRPRGKTPVEDERNIRELLNDDKEKAELNMITDLLRNDLGKVCRSGSVRVEKERQIEKLTSVIHTFSLIKGRLRNDVSPARALVSMFPGGSITGCPKRRAMEIIDELEISNRSAYCGSLFCIDDSGNLDSNILIRTLIKKDRRLILPVGSGVVYDSTEAKEYRENLDKAASITGVLG